MKQQQQLEYIKTAIPIQIPVSAAAPIDLLISHYLATRFIGKAPLTIERCTYSLRQFDRWVAGRPLIKNRKVDLAMYQSWVTHEHHRISGVAAAKVIQETVAFLNWLVLNGILESDTHRLVRQPRIVKKPPRARFTVDEYERLKAAALTLASSRRIKDDGGSAYWLIVAGWATGQSIVDCTLFQQKDVDLESMILTVTRRKTRHSARIHIQAGSDFHLALVERMKDKDPHYPNNPATGTYYLDTFLAAEGIRRLAGYRYSQFMEHWWPAICKLSGVDRRKTFHNFRATMCSMLVNNGVNPVVACQITGHTNLASLAVYATVDDQTIHEAFVSARHKQAVKESIVTQGKLLNASPVTPELPPHTNGNLPSADGSAAAVGMPADSAQEGSVPANKPRGRGHFWTHCRAPSQDLPAKDVQDGADRRGGDVPTRLRDHEGQRTEACLLPPKDAALVENTPITPRQTITEAKETD